MNNTNISFFKKPKPSKTEPNRTRPYVSYTCFHCKQTVEEGKRNFKETKPCKECVKRLRGKENFLIKAKKKFGDLFTIHEDTYFDYTTPVKVTCNIHNHTYQIRPVHFVADSYPDQPHKGGCEKCTAEINKTKNKKDISHYLSKLKEKFSSMSVVSHGNADSNLEQIVLKCPIHGEFSKTLADIVRIDPSVSNLCPKCSQEKLAWTTRSARTDIPGTVYFVHFKDINMYKCGVTYRSVKERFKNVNFDAIDIVWELHFDTLAEAYYFETMFFREHYDQKCEHPNKSFGGYTEFFKNKILKPTKRFVEETLRRKESNSGELPPSNVEDNPERSSETRTCND